MSKLGYIVRYDGGDRMKFGLRESDYRVRNGKVHSKMLSFAEFYETVLLNTQMMQRDGIVLVTEPFFMDDDMKKKVEGWIAWANRTDRSEWDPWWD